MTKLRNLLRCYAIGMSIKSISSAFHLSRNTVRKYVRRYQESGLTLDQLMTMSEEKLQEMFLDNQNRSRKPSARMDELEALIPDYVKRHGYTRKSSIRIEPKANGISVIDQLREVTGLNVTRTPSPKDSKETRLNAVSPTVECGRVILVDGPWNEALIDEVCGFPSKPHDEYVDVLCYAVDYHLENPFKPIDKNKVAWAAFH